MAPEIESFQLQMGAVSQLAMSTAIFCMMLAVALGLRLSDFKFIRSQPSLYVAGFMAQMLVLPVLTIALCHLLNPHPTIALGMLIVACCPGGNVSNLLVLLARGNTALSVSLTATSSVLAAFWTPVAMLFWTGQYAPTAELLSEIDLDVLAFLLQTAAVLALPLVLGMTIAKLSPAFANRLRRPLVTLSSIALAAIIIGTTVKAGDLLISVGGTLIGIVALHNASAYLVGYLMARSVKADVASRRAITFEVGIQNSGLGIVIIMSQMNGMGATAAIAGLWGGWHIIAGMVLVFMFRSSDHFLDNLSNKK